MLRSKQRFHYLEHFQGINIVFVANIVVDVLLNSCNVVVRSWLKYNGEIKIQINRIVDWAPFHYA